jgi:hypothetical protein
MPQPRSPGPGITLSRGVNLPADILLPSGSVGADALSISASDITSLFSGTGAFLKADGTTADASGVSAIADLTDWPEAVSATEVGYLDGLSANIQSQINSITAGAVSILSADPTVPGEGQIWVNTTDSKLKVASSTGVYSTAALTYAAWDTTPTAFSFTDVTDAEFSTVYTSNAIEVAGINYPAAISVSGGTYSINSTETFTGTAGTVALGDLVRARVTSSASSSTAVNAVVTIGGVDDTYTVTTVGAGLFLSDSMYEASSTALSAHAPETGGNWYGDSSYPIDSGETVDTAGARTNVNAVFMAYNSATPPASDYTVTVEGTTGSVSWDRQFAACARMDTTGDAYCMLIQGNSEAYIAKFVDGTMTKIEPVTSQGYSTTTTYAVSITVAGTTISGTVYDGATLKTSLSSTDSDISAKGYAGIMMRGVDARVTNVEAEP